MQASRKAPARRPAHFLPARASKWSTPVFLPPRPAAWRPAESPVGAAASRPDPRGCNRHLISGLCARVPVPEQGTSASTRSKPALGAKSSTSELTTSTFAGRNQFLQQPGTVRMQLQGNNVGLRISFRQHARLAPGRRTTVENSRARPHQQCDQLRGFILDGYSTFSKGARAGNISRPNPARGRQQRPGASSIPSSVSSASVPPPVRRTAATGGCWS